MSSGTIRYRARHSPRHFGKFRIFSKPQPQYGTLPVIEYEPKNISPHLLNIWERSKNYTFFLREFNKLEIPCISKRTAEVLREIELYGVEYPRMRNVTEELGKLLYFLTVNSKSKKIVEIGTSNGYSTVWLALAAKANGGKVTTFEKHRWKAELAEKNLEKAGLVNFARVIIGDARTLISELNGGVDLLFLDILPEDYLTCIGQIVPKMHHGSIVVCDNLLTHRDRKGKATSRGVGGNDYLQFVSDNFNAVSRVLEIGSGIQICRL